MGLVSAYIRMDELRSKEKTLYTTVRFRLVNNDSNAVDELTEFNHRFSGEGRSIGFARLATHDRVKQSIQPDGSLLFVAEVEYLARSAYPACMGKEIVSEAKMKSNCLDALGALLISETDSDCTIVVGKKKIKAHRCVLSASSKVFRAMFASKQSKEAKEGEVHIAGADPKIVSGSSYICDLRTFPFKFR